MDCVNALRDGELAELSRDELLAARQMLKYADEYVSWKAEIEEFDSASVQSCRNCGERAGRDVFINDEQLCEECEENTTDHTCNLQELVYVADIGAPGFGVSVRCRECSKPFVKIGSRVIDPKSVPSNEPPPWELSIEDVI